MPDQIPNIIISEYYLSFSVQNSVWNHCSIPIVVTDEGLVPQQTHKEVVDGVGKPRAWGDGNTRDRAINKIELKWNHLKCRHVEMEMHVKQPYGECSQACTGESACSAVSLKDLFSNAHNMELEEKQELEVCAVTGL